MNNYTPRNDSAAAFLKQAGFTLVELAICLMIIGLLIGGVLRGAEMVHNAKVVATIQQTRAYFAATNTFLGTYGAFPGDMPDAQTRVKNCTAANFCANGNGDGVIGLPILNNNVNINQAITTMPQVETLMYWKHLAAAGLISGVSSGANPAQINWGDTQPMGKLGGGYSVFWMQDQNSNVVGDKGTGLVIRLQGAPNSTGYVSNGAFEQMPISPIDAFRIDLKIDDGLGDSGFVAADHEAAAYGNNPNAASMACEQGNGQYMVSDRLVCVMYFIMN